MKHPFLSVYLKRMFGPGVLGQVKALGLTGMERLNDILPNLVDGVIETGVQRLGETGFDSDFGA